MKFSIDVLFIDQNQIVIKTISRLKPWSISPVASKSWCIIELSEGAIETSQTLVGDRISFF